MTAKPPSSSTLSPDTPIETMATVTFTEIRDSKDNLVGENTTTFDKTLTAKGTAAPNTALWLRDRLTRLDDVTSRPDGGWIKELTLSDFKRYSLNAIEKELPQDSSFQYILVLATETPIIGKVIGKDGPIGSGAIYDGESLMFSGYAPPNMEVEAFNGDTPTGKKTTVKDDGGFELNFDGLTPGPYSIKIRATNGKESDAFEFRVVVDVKLILDKVSDSQGVIAENSTTYDDEVTARGYARPGEAVQLRNNDTPIDGATATAREDDGFWEIKIEVTPNAYSLTVEALYGDGEISEPPYRFNVAQDVELSLDDVADSEGSIDEGGKTRDDKVTVSGHARPGRRVQLRNHDGHIAGAVTTAREDDGFWKIELDVDLGSYSLTVEALYGDGEISDPPRTFTVELDVELSLDDVTDSNGSIPEDGTTYEEKVTANGFAPPGEEVQLLNNGNPINGATTTAGLDGAWEIDIDVTPGGYSLTARALGEVTDPPRTFTVALDVELSLDDVTDSNGSIPEDGTTYEEKVTANGFAPPGEEVQLLNNGNPINGATTTAGLDGAWEIDIDVTPGGYSLTARALGEVTDPPRTFTVALDVELSLDDVTDSNGSIPEDGTTYEEKVTANGFAPPGEEVQLLNNGNPINGATTTAGLDGAWEIDIDVTPGGYSLTARALGEVTDPPRTFTVALDVELSLDDVTDSNGSIPEDGTTYEEKVTANGFAPPGEEVQLLNNGNPINGATTTAGLDGAWEIDIDVTPGGYSLTARALGEVTDPPRTFTVALDVELSLDDV
ncbi:carboxypeptidase-like regulatory domain-containing protein, partial [Pseudomonas fluorescens]